MKVHLRMLGCRLNQSEIDMMARQLQAQGHEIVDAAEQADWFVVNTCAVTQDAVRSSRRLVRDLHHANTAAQISVTGCYAQIAPDEIRTLSGVAAESIHIVDNHGKDTLVEKITGVRVQPFDHEPISRDAHPGAAGRTRAFIKVQDGCDNACTFCVTTVARGAGRSRSIGEIVAEIRALHASGYQEAVLTGVHLGSYGYDLGDHAGLIHLVRAILGDTDLPRLRLSSLEPWDLAPDFFTLWDNPRLGRHLHLPLQSGCDATLRRMARHTNQVEFRALIQAARTAIPNVNITTDVIVGFPGETDEEFAVSTDFIAEMAFSGMHIFRYSKRPGTAAARMKNHLAEAVKKQRSSQLHTLAAAMEAEFARQALNQTENVLWENISGVTQDGFINVGYTDHYIRVRAVHPRVLTNHITPVQMESYDEMLHIMNVTPILYLK